MGEMRCNLDWKGMWPKLVITIEAELTEPQVRALAAAICRTTENKLNCILECGEQCPKEVENDCGGSGNREIVH